MGILLYVGMLFYLAGLITIWDMLDKWDKLARWEKCWCMYVEVVTVLFIFYLIGSYV